MNIKNLSFLILLIGAVHSTLTAQYSISTIAGGANIDGKLPSEIGLSMITGPIAEHEYDVYFVDNNYYQSPIIRKWDMMTGTVTSIAGGGFNSFSENAPALSVRLSVIKGLIIDISGRMYILENDRIKMLNLKTGKLTTFAGGGSSTNDGIKATESIIQNVSAIACDYYNNVYYAELRKIRKIEAGTGVVRTVAGSSYGNEGDGGSAMVAKLGNIQSLAVDGFNNLYLGDADFAVVRKIAASSGIITTIAGTGLVGDSGDGGLATAAQINRPWYMSVDDQGNVYLPHNNRIRVINSANKLITSLPISLTIPTHINCSGDGWLYVFDSYKKLLKGFMPNGYNFLTIGNGTEGVSGIGGLARNVQLMYPRYIASDKTGNTFISDFNNNRIYKVDASTGVCSVFAGTGDYSEPELENISALNTNIGSPGSIILDKDENVYFISSFNKVKKITKATGIITTVAGSLTQDLGDGKAATSASLHGAATYLAIDPEGNLYISEPKPGVVRKVTASTGIISTVAGKLYDSNLLEDNRPASSAGLGGVEGIEVDAAKNIYLSVNNVIRKIDSGTGLISTLQSSKNAAFSSLDAIKLDAAGNFFVSDHRYVKKLAPDGKLSLIAGNGDLFYNGEGFSSDKSSLSPAGLSLDDKGNLFIADSENNRIRKVELGKVLPLAVTRFWAKTSLSNGVLLSWHSENEDPGTVYEVEKRSDKENLRSIGVVRARRDGDGLYQFEDTEGSNTLYTYYRIKQKDQNDAVYYTNWIGVKNESVDSFSFFPNPAVSKVSFSGSVKFISLSDLKGQRLIDLSYANDFTSGTIDVSHLNPGIYILQAVTGSSTIKERLIITK